MTLPLAAVGALVAALLETSVLPELQIGGTKPDLILVLAIVATMVMGVEDGLVWAFVGGLMLDMLVPARPLGATTFVLLLVVGVAILVSRALGQNRVPAIAAAFVLTWGFHMLLLGVLSITEGLTLRSLDPRLVLVAAVLNTLVAIPAAVAFRALERRWGATERSEW